MYTPEATFYVAWPYDDLLRLMNRSIIYPCLHALPVLFAQPRSVAAEDCNVIFQIRHTVKVCTGQFTGLAPSSCSDMTTGKHVSLAKRTKVVRFELRHS
jgi:hypothetical protein